jgi:hypothetical protein
MKGWNRSRQSGDGLALRAIRQAGRVHCGGGQSSSSSTRVVGRCEPAATVGVAQSQESTSVPTRPLNRKSKDRWQANERELLWLDAMPPLDREFHAKREDELLDEQDGIEFRVGLDWPAESRRWSVMV